MIEIKDHTDGCILRVRAQPGARRAGIVGEQAGALKIAVTAAPERGKANEALIEVLCEELGLKKSQVQLLSGETSRDKRLLLLGIKSDVLRAALAKGD